MLLPKQRKKLILEKTDSMATKLLLSGKGRCNFTNLDTSSDHYLGDQTERLSAFFQAFSSYILQKHIFPPAQLPLILFFSYYSPFFQFILLFLYFFKNICVKFTISQHFYFKLIWRNCFCTLFRCQSHIRCFQYLW